MVRRSSLDTHKGLLKSHVLYMDISTRSIFAEQHFDKCMLGPAKDTEYSLVLSPSHIPWRPQIRSQTHRAKYDWLAELFQRAETREYVPSLGM